MNIKQESNIDHNQDSYLDTLHVAAFGGHKFLLLIIIHFTKLPGAHPTLPAFQMKGLWRAG